MQSLIEYLIPITIKTVHGKTVTYFCKEVPVDGTNYYKLITQDGLVAVLVSTGYGGGWSTSCYETSLRKQMILDSRIVQYVVSEDFKEYFSSKNIKNNRKYFTELCNSLFPKDTIKDNYMDIDGFSQLCIDFIKNDSYFRIVEYDGAESIEIFNPTNYMTT